MLPDSPRAVSHFLDAAYAHERGVGGGIGGGITRLRPYICPFEELLKRIPAGARVLDVGCGVGIMSALAAGPGRAREVVGFDISQRAIDVARRVTIPGGAESGKGRGGCPMTFHVLPAGEFPSGQFDAVTCIDVLHHVPPAAQWSFLRSLCARVAPGGRLIFKDISPRPRWKALANRMHDLVMARQWVNYRHEREVEAQLRAFGEIIESTRLDRLWYSHYLIVWRKAS